MGCTVWFTGLPSSGKSTLARMLEQVLVERGQRVEVLYDFAIHVVHE